MRNYNDISKLGLKLVYKCIPVLRRHEHDNVIEHNELRFELETQFVHPSMYGKGENIYRVSEKDASGFKTLGYVVYYHDGGNFKFEDFELVRLWEKEYCVFLTLDNEVLESVEIKESYGGLETFTECQRDKDAGVYHHYKMDYESYKEELWDLPITGGNTNS